MDLHLDADETDPTHDQKAFLFKYDALDEIEDNMLDDISETEEDDNFASHEVQDTQSQDILASLGIYNINNCPDSTRDVSDDIDDDFTVRWETGITLEKPENITPYRIATLLPESIILIPH